MSRFVKIAVLQVLLTVAGGVFHRELVIELLCARSEPGSLLCFLGYFPASLYYALTMGNPHLECFRPIADFACLVFFGLLYSTVVLHVLPRAVRCFRAPDP